MDWDRENKVNLGDTNRLKLASKSNRNIWQISYKLMIKQAALTLHNHTLQWSVTNAGSLASWDSAAALP